MKLQTAYSFLYFNYYFTGKESLLERLDQNDAEVAEHISKLERPRSSPTVVEDSKSGSRYKQRKEQRERRYKEIRDLVWARRLAVFAPLSMKCELCDSQFDDVSVYCSSCKREMCHKCDIQIHTDLPFHQRTAYIASEFVSCKLFPNWFVDNNGDIQEIGMKSFIICYFTSILLYSFCFLTNLFRRSHSV